MKKKDLLKALEAIGDDDHVVIKCDGGDYWGDYLDEVVVEEEVMLYDYSLGHPGGYDNSATVLPAGTKFIVLKG